MGINTSIIDDIRRQAWDEAVLTYGTAYIFEQRANKYRWFLRIISFLGIVVPLTIGAIYLSFSSQQMLLDVAVLVASILGIIQLVLSVWSLSAKWEDTYSYALESQVANYGLATRFEKLGKYPPSEVPELQMEFRILDTENRQRTEQDNKQGISDKEKRMGMRAALRKFQRQCSGCKIAPISMKPTNCDVCGNF